MKRKYILSLMICGMLFACSDKKTNNNEAIDAEPSQTVVEYEENEQGLAFYPLDDGTYGVGVGNAKFLSNIIVPSSFRGKPVTKVVNCGFDGETNRGMTCKSITLPDSIIEIGENGLSASSIESIQLSKSLKKIGSWGLCGESIKEIKYNGTFDEFKKIEFGECWMSIYFQDGAWPTFSLSDKTFIFDSLFDHFLFTAESHEIKYNETDKTFKIEMQAHDLDSYIVVNCYLETTGFGGLTKMIDGPSAIASIEDENIVYHQTESWQQHTSKIYLRVKGNVGSTNINFTYGNVSSTLVFEATPDIKVSVADLINMTSESEENNPRQYLYKYYEVEGYISSIIGYDDNGSYYYSSFYIKDSVDAESQFMVQSRSEVNLNDLQNTTKIKCIGGVLDSGRFMNPDTHEYEQRYYLRSSYNLTIIE